METISYCATCGEPFRRQKAQLATHHGNYCSRACFQQVRKARMDSALEYVQDNHRTETLGEMAKELGVTKEALSYRIACWRDEGRLDGQSRTYNPRLKPEQKSEYFDWLEFENDVIVGGNLFPDFVTGWKDELPGEEMPRLSKRYVQKWD